VLIAIPKKYQHLPSSFHELLQILSFTMFDPPKNSTNYAAYNRLRSRIRASTALAHLKKLGHY
jgi:hypothetical protein